MRFLGIDKGPQGRISGSVDLDLVLQEFYAEVWDVIHAAENIKKDEDMVTAEEKLRGLFQNYYKVSSQWMTHQTQDVSDESLQEPKARGVRRLSSEVMPKFERGMYRYTLCYMHLHRALVQFKHQIEYFRKKHIADAQKKSIDVGDSTGLLLKRAYKEKRGVLERRARMIKAQKVLEELDSHFQSLQKALRLGPGKKESKRSFIRFRGFLRHGEFDKAQEVINAWSQKKGILSASQKVRDNIVSCAQNTMSYVQDHKDVLVFGNNYMLEPKELKLAFSFLMDDEERVDRFLRKYNFPYMDHKFNVLLNQAYKLGQVGTVETLLTLHVRLLTSQVKPIKNMAQVRHLEREVIGRCQTLIAGRISDIPNIFDEMEVATAQLRYLLSETHALEELSGKIPRTEI